ncbi:uncharacterized protein LOC132196749 isoform X2 [Neocloeon triangulifer]|uniref:uncharacterized protein LOC132196749 isoform X2 n=1 Tax=Neocloeon triangulifer TaxID=2078957 RepID=UPI00286F8B68|nr:uncharacterized protein LOC132196749 isoform X2 [Neocloeon triangulifer]
MEKKNQEEGASPEAKRPRRPTRSTGRPTDRHRHSSEMHRAIEDKDFNTIEKLLSKGETFCNGEGLNCFILAACSCMNGSPLASRWKFTQKMLNIDPQTGLSARNTDGSTLLMIFSNCPAKIEFLANLGANLNDVDNDGDTVLMRSYMHSNGDTRGFLKLLELGASPNMPAGNKYPNMISFFISNYCISAKPCFKYLMRPEFFSKIEESQFSENPIFSCLEGYCKLNLRTAYSDSSDSLEEVLKDKISPRFNILATRKTSLFSPENGYPVWNILKQVLNIPEEILLDPQGYYLFTVSLHSFLHNDQPYDAVKVQLRAISKLGYVAPKNAKALPLNLALLYNAIQRQGIESIVTIGRAPASFICEFCLKEETFDDSCLEMLNLLAPYLSLMSLSPRLIDSLSKFAQQVMSMIPENPFDLMNQIVMNMRLMFSHSPNEQRRFVENFCMRPLWFFIKIFLGPNCSLRWDKFLHKDLDGKILDKVEEFLKSRKITTEDIEEANVRGKVQSLEALSVWCVRRRLFQCRKEGEKLVDCVSKLVESTPIPTCIQNELLLFK